MGAVGEMVDYVFGDGEEEELLDFQEKSFGRENHDKVVVQVVDQEWTRTLRARNIPSFSVEYPGPTNNLHVNLTELNFLNFFSWMKFMKFW